jgi:predicted tellurium resistance membrane protein TerC
MSLSDPQIWLSFFTLLIMELVLGIDNIIFISLLSNELPLKQRKKGRILGITLALSLRILMLIMINWVMSLTEPFINLSGRFGIHEGAWQQRLALSGRDVIMLTGGLFLIYKSNREIYETIEKNSKSHKRIPSSFLGTILQIGFLDLVLGIDSVITAVGMADHLFVMIAAVIVAMAFMLMASVKMSKIVGRHPSIKLVALAFLFLVGISLVAEGFNEPIPKGYIYFAMVFSIFIECLILRFMKNKVKPLDYK